MISGLVLKYLNGECFVIRGFYKYTRLASTEFNLTVPFYQLLSYKDDVDLEAKLDEWERFYNFHRPHGAHNGKTPYEVLREKL
jgi:transposase InsO family protein